MELTLAHFGKATEPYTKAGLIAAFMAGGCKRAEQYLARYFAKIDDPPMYAVWNPVKRTVTMVNGKQLAHLCPILEVSTLLGKYKLNACKMVTGFELVALGMDPARDRTWTEHKQVHVNQFGGWKWPHTDAGASAGADDEKSTEGVQLWLRHIREVICGDDAEAADYVVRWFARIAQKGKNETGLSVIGPEQGSGKSILFKFIVHHVFGLQACLPEARTGAVVGQFNAELLGRVLVVFEEARTNEHDWVAFYDNLKGIITSSTIQISEKYKTPYTAKNTSSVAVLANHQAVRGDWNNDRRWALLDVTPKYAGVKNVSGQRYFRDLATTMNDKVGRAFWRYLLRVDLTGHPDLTPPETKLRMEARYEACPVFFRWLKEAYMTHKNQGFKAAPFESVYLQYERWHRANPGQRTIQSKKAIGIITAKLWGDKKKKMRFGDGVQLGLGALSHAEMYAFYKLNGWLSEEDDVPDPDAQALAQFLPAEGKEEADDAENEEEAAEEPVPEEEAAEEPEEEKEEAAEEAEEEAEEAPEEEEAAEEAEEEAEEAPEEEAEAEEAPTGLGLSPDDVVPRKRRQTVLLDALVDELYETA